MGDWRHIRSSCCGASGMTFYHDNISHAIKKGRCTWCVLCTNTTSIHFFLYMISPPPFSVMRDLNGTMKDLSTIFDRRLGNCYNFEFMHVWSQGFLKLFAGVDVQFTLTTKSSDSEDDMQELYVVRVRMSTPKFWHLSALSSRCT